MQKFTSQSEQETRELAKKFAKTLKKSAVLALKGPLGSGKTTFIKSLAKALGVKSRVQSPTFALLSEHSVKSGRFKHFFHLDLYRLQKKAELEELGITELLTTPRSITAIEWPKKAKSFLPKHTINLSFKHGKKTNQRHISIKA